MKRILKLLRVTTWYCTTCVSTVLLWTFWLALAALIVIQATIATSRELALPVWARTQIENRLARMGIRGSFGPTVFDTSGRIWVRDLKILHPTLDEPLLDAASIYVRFDPRWISVGRFEPLEIEVEGATLWLPSMHSATGRAEPTFKDISLHVASEGSRLSLSGLSTQLGNLAISIHGQLNLPRKPRSLQRTGIDDLWQEGIRIYLRQMRQVQRILEWLGRFDDAHLNVELRESPARGLFGTANVEFTASHFRVPDNWTRPLGGSASLQGLTVHTFVPLGGDGPEDIQITCAAVRVQGVEGRFANDMDALLIATLDPNFTRVTPLALKARIAKLAAPPWSADAVGLETKFPSLDTQITARIGGEPWSVNVRSLDVKKGHMDLRLDAGVSPQIIEWAGGILKRSLEKELTLTSNPRLLVDIDLDNGWKLQRCKGRISVDSVVAHKVALDRASAAFELAGTSLRFDDIILKQGPSIAKGSYWMDTGSLDFRFLLDGRLRPEGISGWFHDWWPVFWENFDFTKSVPSASVDIQGRWGRNADLSVFVAVENGPTAIHGIWFDQARTRLLVRPHFYDALYFRVNQGDRTAYGRFSRTVNWEKRLWSKLEFDATSNVDLADAARVIGIEGLGIVEPFSFSQPPQLKLHGHLDGPGAPKGEHRDVSLAFYAAGPGSYYEFPLKDVSVSGTIKDDDIVLDPFATDFAQGTAEGRFHLSGKEGNRRLGFDLRVKNAALGEAIRVLEEFSAKRAGREIPKESKLQKQIAAGRIDVAISADGMFDNLLSYQGQGNAQLTGADLAEINLFGVLSQVLKRTLFNFTTLKLDAMQANFAIQGPKLNFSQLRVTGPRALIDAKGDYLLDKSALDVKAKLYPFGQDNFILSNAVGLVLSPLSEVLEFKLTGQLDDPNWSFVYGPSNFLRALRGGDSKPSDSSHPPEK